MLAAYFSVRVLPRLVVALRRLVLAEVLAEEGQGLSVLVRRRPTFPPLAAPLILAMYPSVPLWPLVMISLMSGTFSILLAGGGRGTVRQADGDHAEGGEQARPDVASSPSNTLSLSR